MKKLLAVLAFYAAPALAGNIVISGGSGTIAFLTTPTSSTFSGGYNYRKTITISSANVSNISGTLTDFPVLVSTNDITLSTTTGSGGLLNSSGMDLIFSTMSDCSYKLNWDTETIQNVGVSSFSAWVKVPVLTTATLTAATFYMCYGNPGVTTYQGISTATWSNGYLAVYHYKNGVILSGVDASSNTNNQTFSGSPTAITGLIDGGANFTTVGPQYGVAQSTVNINNVSISAWVKVASYPATNGFIAGFVNGPASGTNDKDLYIDTSGLPKFYIFDGSSEIATGATPIGTNVWSYVAGTADGANINVYLNGAKAASAAATFSFTGYTVPNMFVGGNTGNGAGIGGFAMNYSADEVRFSWAVRNSDWIKTEYNNQNSPSTFITVGAQTLPAPPAPGGTVSFNGSGT